MSGAGMGLLAAWDQRYRALSGIADEMIGAARYFAEHPDYATDEVVAEAFRTYAGRLAAVEIPS